MELNEIRSGTESEITIKGRFTFVDHLSFRNIINNVTDAKFTKLTLDFAQVEFVDSAALGILLLLRDEAQKHNISLILRHPAGQVKKMFEISRFYDLFTVIEK